MLLVAMLVVFGSNIRLRWVTHNDLVCHHYINIEPQIYDSIDKVILLWRKLIRVDIVI